MGSNLARAARHKEIYRVCQLIAVSFSFTSIPCTRLAIVCFVAENMRVTMQYFFFYSPCAPIVMPLYSRWMGHVISDFIEKGEVTRAIVVQRP